jgi:hypothetical protein
MICSRSADFVTGPSSALSTRSPIPRGGGRDLAREQRPALLVGEARAAAIEREHGGKVEVDGICSPARTLAHQPVSRAVHNGLAGGWRRSTETLKP